MPPRQLILIQTTAPKKSLHQSLFQDQLLVLPRTVKIRQVRGQQYKYKGHIINFLRDTGRVYKILPLLPQNLDIVILRPFNTADPRLSRQFVRDLHMGAVSQWLHFLYRHHPGYFDIEISREALDRLPQDASVVGDILIQETEAEGQSSHDAADADDDPAPDTAAVPDLTADDTEVNAIREQVLPHNQLPPSSFLALLSWSSTVPRRFFLWLSPACSHGGTQNSHFPGFAM
jgi:hypothetical protein